MRERENKTNKKPNPNKQKHLWEYKYFVCKINCTMSINSSAGITLPGIDYTPLQVIKIKPVRRAGIQHGTRYGQ